MNRQAVVVKQYWASTVNSVSEGLRKLKNELSKLPHLPKDIVIISAGEVKPLLNPLIQQFCLQLEQQQHCHVHFISAACTSLHAAILDFNHHQVIERLIITLELDQSLQQGCLNALGIGIEPEQDGLEVIDGVGYCLIEKTQPDEHSLVIEDCVILSQPMGMTGIQKLINLTCEYMQQLPEKTRAVSFDICSNWGKKLIKGMDNRLIDAHRSKHWLPSAEQHNHHFLSLKPTLELQRYEHHLEQGNLLLMTLGGGGRIGCLRISRGVTDIRMQAKATYTEHSLSDDINSYHYAVSIQDCCVDTYYQGVKDTLKYPQHCYRGINNHYFRWTKDNNQNSGTNP